MINILNNFGSNLKEFSFTGYIILLTVSVIIGLFLLTKGGDFLSDYCSIFAEKLGIPSIIVGLTIVSIATSAPELFTSISAISSNAGGLVIGNITGSNIANIGLILGISLLIKPISTHGAVKPMQLILLLSATFGFSFSIIFNGKNELGLALGIVLIVFILSYLAGLSISALKNRDGVNMSNQDSSVHSLLFVTSMIGFGGVMLWVGSETLVYGSKNFAEMAGIPDELIGFTLIAIGTSLPELAASISLIKKNETSMLLGNIIGSNLFNIGLVGGVAGIIGPVFSVTTFPWMSHASMILFTTILAMWLIGKKLTSKHGIALLALYVLATATTWIMNS
ncbi:sodium:calcium antiporter [Opitutales bacterium]|nr:sodium:calcium antiporter [Opitutales bacterium]